MSSWLARSVANSLISGNADDDDDDGGEEEEEEEASISSDRRRSGMNEEELGEDRNDPNRGVKEDISQLTQTLTRQFWGVASFLAPNPSSSSSPPPPQPPPPPPPPPPLRPISSFNLRQSPEITGIRSDFAEIGGSLRSGISMLSNKAAVSEIGKIASNFLPFRPDEDNQHQLQYEDEEDEDTAIGVTDEVMAFVLNIAMHPETWLDFPLFNDFEDTNDFEMSEAQLQHAFVVESLEPRFAALRIELCPAHMTEGCFWKIYFILLHSRLNKQDAILLSTPQIVEARAMYFRKLQELTKPESYGRGPPCRNEDITSISSRGQIMEQSQIQSPTSSTWLSSSESKPDQETKHTGYAEDGIVDESVTKERGSMQPNFQSYDDDDGDDEWFIKEEASDMVSGRTIIPYGDEEDVSFSDLEEEDEPRAPSSSKCLTSEIKASSTGVL